MKNDTVYRQAAIDVVFNLDASNRVSWKDAVIDALDALPPAQPAMNMHNVRPGDQDYPLHMLLVEDREKYDLISVDGLVLIPLFQVVDKLMCVTPDVIIRNGKRICPNCGAKMKGEDDVKR